MGGDSVPLLALLERIEDNFGLVPCPCRQSECELVAEARAHFGISQARLTHPGDLEDGVSALAVGE